jgi:hypothetical protein
MCHGIGIEQNDIVPFLDSIGLARRITDDLENGTSFQELEREHSFSTLSNDEQFDLLSEKFFSPEDGYTLVSLLKAAEEMDALIICNNNHGKYFLLYTPRYPWQDSGGFTSQEEVVGYICDLLMSFCRDDVERQEIINIIDADIHELGSG